MKEELIKQILSIHPSPEQVTLLFNHEENGVRVEAKETILSRFGQYYLGIGEGWVWFDRDKTYKDRVTGEVKKSFNDTLMEGHTFLQDATVEELQELINYLKS